MFNFFLFLFFCTAHTEEKHNSQVNWQPNLAAARTWQNILYSNRINASVILDAHHRAVAPLLFPSVSRGRQLLLFHMSHQAVSYSLSDYCEHGYHHSCNSGIFGRPLFVTPAILQPCPLAGEKGILGDSVGSIKRSQGSDYMRQRERLYETRPQHMALLKSWGMRL